MPVSWFTKQYLSPRKINLTELRTVISFSLYGDVQKYFNGLLENCKEINEIYPNFWIYVYVGNDVNKNICIELTGKFKNLLFIDTNKLGHEVMSHRFFTIDRPEVGIAFSRDLDSRVNKRDQYCIDEFLKSNKYFQIIRDNPAHGTEILGGMWGIKKGLFSSSIYFYFNIFKLSSRLFEHGTDQIFLSRHIYPLVVSYSIVFDEYFHYYGESPQKIEAGGDYVGMCIF